MNDYTEYCTCFYVVGEKKVYFYDEIKGSTIKTQKVKDETEADEVMQAWVDKAPEGIICQRL